MAAPVVVGYDGTDGAKAALEEALSLAGELGAELVVVFVYHFGAAGGEAHDLVDALRERGQDVAEEALARARAAGVQARAELVNDKPAEGVAGVAKEEGARMIVVGSYGERPLRSVLVGSTPTRLLHLSERPVLVVRASRHE